VPSRRCLAVLLAGAAAVTGLAGCRTSPNVAAYVGESEVTVAELDAAVAERLADPRIAAYAADDDSRFLRQVLSLQVGEEVYAAAADRYDVQVTDGDVRARIDELLAGSDPDEVYAQVAEQQGAGRADVAANVREQLVRRRVAVAAGKADLSEDALRATYDEQQAALTTVQLGIVTVPDQPTADAVLAELVADPAGYPAVAARYAGANTLPAVQSFTATDLPGVLADRIAATPAGQGFTQPVAEAGGVVVGLVQAVAVPAFADVRDQLAEQAGADADEAGAVLVEAVREELDVDVNPRYGVLDEGRVVAGDGGVVQLLQGGSTAAAGD